MYGPVCPLCLSDDQLCTIEFHNNGLARKPLCVIVSREPLQNSLAVCLPNPKQSRPWRGKCLFVVQALIKICISSSVFRKHALYAFFFIHYLYLYATLITLFMFTVNIPEPRVLGGEGGGRVW